jgi:CheY-like chemotaxis protein
MAYRILLVEDENLIRVMLSEMLQDAGYDVVEAATGDEACTLMHGVSGFDVLLTDIQMPGQADGIDVAHQFQAHHPNAPVVYMTGRPDMMARIGHLATGEALLRKPFRPRQMLDALDGLLAREH